MANSPTSTARPPLVPGNVSNVQRVVRSAVPPRRRTASSGAGRAQLAYVPRST